MHLLACGAGAGGGRELERGWGLVQLVQRRVAAGGLRLRRQLRRDLPQHAPAARRRRGGGGVVGAEAAQGGGEALQVLEAALREGLGRGLLQLARRLGQGRHLAQCGVG